MGICDSKPIKTKRKAITKKQAKIAFDRCSGLCFYCDKPLGKFENRKNRWEVDHAFALAQGGQNQIDNYLASCFDCNRTKHDKKQKDFLNQNKLNRRCIYLTGKVYCKTKTLNNNLNYCITHQFANF